MATDRQGNMEDGRRQLIVWDFDWSLIEENSDTFVIQQIGAHDIFTRCLSATAATATLAHTSGQV